MLRSYTSTLLATLALISGTSGQPSSSLLQPRQNGGSTGYANPASGGGRMLTYIPNLPTNVGEPINVIISSQSDRYVLTTAGFIEWANSVQLIPNACVIRDNIGGAQQANLGDGNGREDQLDVLRYSYWTDNTCAESINGGNHARYWRQNGSSADTRAWFLAASVEMPIAQNHMVLDNGYDLGRDWIVGNATQSNGTLSTSGYVFQATSTNAPLLSSVSTSDMNHNIATDGNVAVLTVRLIRNGTDAASNSNSTPSGGNGASGTGGGGSSGAGTGSGRASIISRLSLSTLAVGSAGTLFAVSLATFALL
ncbi:hypothetical protein V8E36_006693 [Tilletia maclaganii]